MMPDTKHAETTARLPVLERARRYARLGADRDVARSITLTATVKMLESEGVPRAVANRQATRAVDEAYQPARSEPR
jgi:hypothetical protein